MSENSETNHVTHKATSSSSIGMDYFGSEHVITVPNSRMASGAFGEISLAIIHHASEVRVVAVKALFQSTNHQEYSPDVANEVAALRKLGSHDHVVTLRAMYSSGPSLSLAFDYCPTDLAFTMQWRRKSFLPLISMPVIKSIARDLFAGLDHLHSHDVLHLDVTPANLLVTPTGHVQICDFGLSQFTTSIAAAALNNQDATSSYSTIPRGLCTLHYRPPEMLLGCAPTDASVDVYSAGLVVCELLLGRPLFPGRSVLDQLTLIFRALGTPTIDSWPDVAAITPDYTKLRFEAVPPKGMASILPRATESDHLVELLEQLVTLDPRKRLSSRNVMEHAWLQSQQQQHDTTASFAHRRLMVQGLIPEPLEEPVLLFVPSDGAALRVAESQVQALATARRKFLSMLGPTLRVDK
ncbi:hypothetical protein MPSEU_000144200 [Mayamaea pseudoterrestris]|nr:hypothetical protein MPSEU_000144200 [Mayamaea pseudoterrestris]